ncbi:YuzB family protein [Bacillaceae bacterium S4-13-58]
MNPIIEFCSNNLASGSHKAFEELEKDSNLDVIEYGCLSHCGLCSRSLFALVNGDRVVGETPEELVKNIYQYIEDNPMF